MALETWLQRSQEFPTPADIIGLIQRNGKPPLKESDIITIRKKDGELRTPDEWAMLREWDKQQMAGWDDAPSAEKQEATMHENFALRRQVKELEQKVRELSDTLHRERIAKGAEAPKQSEQDKIMRTVAEMRRSGVSEQAIQEFMSQYPAMQQAA